MGEIEVTPEELAKYLLAKARVLARMNAPKWTPMAHQVPPEGWGEAYITWAMIGGRGIGKTDGGAHTLNEEMMLSPGRRSRIIAPTLGDAVKSCVDGASGLKAHNSQVVLKEGTRGLRVEWPNRSVCYLYGASSLDDVERLRAGGNSELDWCEEFATWRYIKEALEQARFGLRLGKHPKRMVTSTPKPRPEFIKLVRDLSTVVTRANTDENPYLVETVRRAFFEEYGGTRIGRQELYGEILEDIEGALWSGEMIERSRWKVGKNVPDMQRVIVAIDPAVTSNEESDETGIVVVASGICRCKGFEEKHGFVFEDLSGRYTPDEWAQKAVDAYRANHADRVIGEVNNGGDMIEHTLRTVDRSVSYRSVRATRGKIRRAEPVKALYEQNKVHHVGIFDRLEDQMTTFDPERPNDSSPDRMDALVWGLTELLVMPMERGGLVGRTQTPMRRLQTAGGAPKQGWA